MNETCCKDQDSIEILRKQYDQKPLGIHQFNVNNCENDGHQKLLQHHTYQPEYDDNYQNILKITADMMIINREIIKR